MSASGQPFEECHSYHIPPRNLPCFTTDLQIMVPQSSVYEPYRILEGFLDQLGFESESEPQPRKRRPSREIRIHRPANGPKYHLSYPASPGRRGPRNVNITLRTVNDKVEEVPESGKQSRTSGTARYDLNIFLDRWNRLYKSLRFKVAKGSPILLALVCLVPLLLGVAAFQSKSPGSSAQPDTNRGASICKSTLIQFGLKASGLRFLCAGSGDITRSPQQPCAGPVNMTATLRCVGDSPLRLVAPSKDFSVLHLGYEFPQTLSDVRYGQIYTISEGLHDLVLRGVVTEGDVTLNALKEVSEHVIRASKHGRNTITNSRGTISYAQALMDSLVVRLRQGLDSEALSTHQGFLNSWGQHRSLDPGILVETITKSVIPIKEEITHIDTESNLALKDLKLARKNLGEFGRSIHGKFLDFKAQCNTRWYIRSPHSCRATNAAEYRKFVIETQVHITAAMKRLGDVAVQLEALKDTVDVTSLHLDRISTAAREHRSADEILASMQGILKSCGDFVVSLNHWKIASRIPTVRIESQ